MLAPRDLPDHLCICTSPVEEENGLDARVTSADLHIDSQQGPIADTFTRAN